MTYSTFAFSSCLLFFPCYLFSLDLAFPSGFSFSKANYSFSISSLRLYTSCWFWRLLLLARRSSFSSVSTLFSSSLTYGFYSFSISSLRLYTSCYFWRLLLLVSCSTFASTLDSSSSTYAGAPLGLYISCCLPLCYTGSTYCTYFTTFGLYCKTGASII